MPVPRVAGLTQDQTVGRWKAGGSGDITVPARCAAVGSLWTAVFSFRNRCWMVWIYHRYTPSPSFASYILCEAALSVHDLRGKHSVFHL